MQQTLGSQLITSKNLPDRCSASPMSDKCPGFHMKTSDTWMQFLAKLSIILATSTVTRKRVSLNFHCHWKLSVTRFQVTVAVTCASINCVTNNNCRPHSTHTQNNIQLHAICIQLPHKSLWLTYLQSLD